jgi:hypothetical protein
MGSELLQGQPLHCSGLNDDPASTGVTASCELFNPTTQQYDPFPSLPITYTAPGFGFQMVCI